MSHNLSEEQWNNFAERIKMIQDSFRKMAVKFNVDSALTKILKAADIKDPQDLKDCKMLFKDKKIEDIV